MKKKIILIIVIILVTLISYFVLMFFAISKEFKHDGIANNLKFDKKVWENGTIRQRGQMSNYLLDSIGILNKDKETIINILGEPDDSVINNDGEYKSRLIYNIDKGDMFNYEMKIFFDSLSKANFILFDD